jgi:hypothetical protein
VWASRHLALQHKSGSVSVMRITATQMPIISAATPSGLRGLGDTVLLVLVLILTSITGAVSAPAS